MKSTCSNKTSKKKHKCCNDFSTARKVLILPDSASGNKALAFMIDENGNPYGKLKGDKYDNMNELQKLLYENSFYYRCKFIEPIEISLK